MYIATRRHVINPHATAIILGINSAEYDSARQLRRGRDRRRSRCGGNNTKLILHINSAAALHWVTMQRRAKGTEAT